MLVPGLVELRHCSPCLTEFSAPEMTLKVQLGLSLTREGEHKQQEAIWDS